MTQQRSEEIMRRYLTEVVAQGKLELIPELAAEDMEDHTNDTPGRAGLEQHVKGFRAAIPDLELELERIIASDDAVVGLWTWTGTPAVEFFGVPPTGVKVECKVASVFQIKDGMLADYVVFADALGTARQMGAEIKLPEGTRA